MLLLNSLGGGRYLTIGTLLHRALEIGYQFYDDNYFDISLSYVTKGPHSGLKFSLSCFKFFFECNLYNTKQWEPKELVIETETEIEIEEEEVDDEFVPPALPEKSIPSIEGRDEYSETFTFASSTPFSTVDVAMQAAKETTIVPIKATLGSLAEQEIAEYGNIALRQWVGSEGGTDELVDGSKTLKTGITILIRAVDGGFHFLKLWCDDNGWYVNDPKTHEFVDVVFDAKRKLWVIDRTF